jgi:hypothetical protein
MFLRERISRAPWNRVFYDMSIEIMEVIPGHGYRRYIIRNGLD